MGFAIGSQDFILLPNDERSVVRCQVLVGLFPETQI
jgi:hypothetical protein